MRLAGVPQVRLTRPVRKVRGVSAEAQRMTLRALNRALLARQGLLERLDAPLVEAVEAIGALQAQYWPAPLVALWSRVAGFEAERFYAALEDAELVSGTLLRATLHVVSAREHPAYASVAAQAAGHHWRRTKAEPGDELPALLARLLRYAARTPRTGEQIAAVIEEWVAAHPDALHPDELEHQRRYEWRPFQRWSSFVRAPADGVWGPKAPSALRTAPRPRGAPKGDAALDEVVRRHLRAFGPADAGDVAGWIGWRTPPVRAALERLAPGLARFEDEDGRTLYDLSDAPRPDPETPAPPRLLSAFDSVLLAYAGKHRQRILPDAHRDAVYERRNLQIRPSYLVDGRVAGTWSIEVKRRTASLTLRPLERLARATRGALVDEAERLVRDLQPQARAHNVVVKR
jgi:hypothetical protein